MYCNTCSARRPSIIHRRRHRGPHTCPHPHAPPGGPAHAAWPASEPTFTKRPSKQLCSPGCSRTT
eukprot:4507435-Prymnesium_polylepis.1